MNICSKCKITEVGFQKSGRKVQWCKNCRSEYDRLRYPERRNAKILKTTIWRKKTRSERISQINELKKDRPCADCNGHFPPICMDFDHISGVKADNISTMVSTKIKSLKEIKEEIKKCELVCANCHRIRTAKRGGWEIGLITLNL